jgi:hypothetical protein
LETTNNMAGETSFRLMNLPPELRLEIYDHFFQAIYPPRFLKDKAILAANHQVFCETLPALKRVLVGPIEQQSRFIAKARERQQKTSDPWRFALEFYIANEKRDVEYWENTLKRLKSLGNRFTAVARTSDVD